MNLIVYLSRLLLISSRLIHHTFVVKLKSEFIQKRPPWLLYAYLDTTFLFQVTMKKLSDFHMNLSTLWSTSSTGKAWLLYVFNVECPWYPVKVC